tara:strand:- start:90 stop:254 length:165 start_codon:yes stop_codon:yes gene_type:complete
MKIELNEQDGKLLLDALCFYDMHKDGYFNPDENDSFSYLYGTLSKVAHTPCTQQ